MKICFLTPGEIDIPPNGWGALETVVWNQKQQLDSMGFDTLIVNEPDIQQAYQKIVNFDPDIVHLHYGKHFELLPYINTRKIITNHDGSFLNSYKFHEQIIRKFMYDCEFFVLTSWEQNLLLDIGISPFDIKILPNGVDINSFKFEDKPSYDKSICLGKIDNRKNQSKLQSLNCDIVFVGQNNDTNFNPLDSNYLGLWDRQDVFQQLTKYCNLVLLSNAELQPLVCLEAMSAGLGLVLSEVCSQNLDTSLDFITIIPNSQMHNNEYIKKAIIDNREYCKSINRQIIKEYAQNFDWKEIVKRYIQYIT